MRCNDAASRKCPLFVSAGSRESLRLTASRTPVRAVVLGIPNAHHSSSTWRSSLDECKMIGITIRDRPHSATGQTLRRRSRPPARYALTSTWSRPAELKARGGAVAVEVGEHRRQRVRRDQMSVLGRCRRLATRACSPKRGDGAGEATLRLRRPVQVVENQDNGCIWWMATPSIRDDGIEECIALGIRVGARRRGRGPINVC